MLYVACAIFLSGCTPTKAWLNRDYLGGTVTNQKAVENINDCIKGDRNARKQAEKLQFSYGGNVPVTGDSWINNANIELSFETEGNGKINSIILAYSNADSSCVDAAVTLVQGIAEMIDPLDYAFSEKNKSEMLNHLDLYHADFRVHTFNNNNNTRIEKIDTNQLFLPLTIVRFSKQDNKTLDVYCQEVAYRFIENPQAVLSLLGMNDNTSSKQGPTSNYAASNEVSGANEEKVNQGRKSSETSVTGVFTGNDLTLGEFSIGDAQEKVNHILGKPQKVRQGNEGRVHYTYDDMEVVICQGKISALISNSPLAVTPRGIHEGSSLQEVVNLYGNDYLVSEYDGDTLYEYKVTSKDLHSCYLRFAIKNSNQRVDYISMRFAQ